MKLALGRFKYVHNDALEHGKIRANAWISNIVDFMRKALPKSNPSYARSDKFQDRTLYIFSTPEILANSANLDVDLCKSSTKIAAQ